MKAVAALVGFGLFLLLTPAEAVEQIGRVRALYVQSAPGVLVEVGLLRAGPGRRWADVEAADGRRQLVLVPSGLDVRRGDHVQLRPGVHRSSKLARQLPVLRVGRVLGIEDEGRRLAVSEP